MHALVDRNYLVSVSSEVFVCKGGLLSTSSHVYNPLGCIWNYRLFLDSSDCTNILICISVNMMTQIACLVHTGSNQYFMITAD